MLFFLSLIFVMSGLLCGLFYCVWQLIRDPDCPPLIKTGAILGSLGVSGIAAAAVLNL